MAVYIFDMDGTLANSEDLSAKAAMIAYQKGITQLQLDTKFLPTATETLALSYGKSIVDNIQTIRNTYNERAQAAKQPLIEQNAETWKTKILDHYHKNIEQLRSQVDTSSYLIADSIELLKELSRRGHNICIVSGSSREDISSITRLAGIADLLDRFWGAEDYNHGKPHPEPYEKAREYYKKVGHSTREMLVIEDSEAGAASAQAAGLYCVIRGSQQDAEKFAKYKPVAVLEELSTAALIRVLPNPEILLDQKSKLAETAV